MPHCSSSRPTVQLDRPQLSGAGLGVTNLDRAIEWYRQLFDLDVGSRFRVTSLDLEICILRRDRFSIELVAPALVAPPPLAEAPPRHAMPGRIAHIAFEVGDIASFLTRLSRCGGRELWRSPAGSPGTFFFVSDPDGNLLQIIERGRDRG